MSTYNLNTPQPLWGNDAHLPAPMQKPDIKLSTGMILRWNAQEQQYLPVLDAEYTDFENVTPDPPPAAPPPAAPPQATRNQAQVKEQSVLEYASNATKLMMFVGGLMLAIGTIKISVALIDVLIEGIYSKLMPALFSGLAEAGYYLGVGIVSILALFILSFLVKARKTRVEEETDDPKPVMRTTNIFQWFIVNDADTAQQTVDQFKNTIQ